MRTTLIAAVVLAVLAAGAPATASERALVGAGSAPLAAATASTNTAKAKARARAKAKRKAAAKSLAGRLFWRYDAIRADRSADVLGVAFVNARFAHIGIPERGLPRCKRPTPKREDGKLVSGCVRYSHNARTGAVRVGKLRGTYRKRKLRLAKEPYYNTTIPKRGARYDVELVHRGFRGLCGLILGCTTWREELVMTRAGKFVLSESSISTFGGVGTPFIWAGDFPPDEHGTYRVLDRGRLRLAYADGSVKVHTMAIDHNKADRADATGEGVLLGDRVFLPEGDD